MGKRYYWLKLHDDYFDDSNIKIIEDMENGGKYLLFLFKLKLKSIRTEGYLRVTDTIPYNEDMLATITNTDIDVVRSAMKVLVEFDLIEILEDDTLYVKCVELLIGSETDVARRVRKHREKKELLHGNKMKQISNTELELEKEKEKELKKDTLSGKPDYRDMCDRVINFLNKKANKYYRISTKSIESKIIARLKEGFTIQDFAHVITIKCDDWLNDPKMKKYIRPETLFCASHFQSYLNDYYDKYAEGD